MEQLEERLYHLKKEASKLYRLCKEMSVLMWQNYDDEEHDLDLLEIYLYKAERYDELGAVMNYIVNKKIDLNKEDPQALKDECDMIEKDMDELKNFLECNFK